MSKAKIPWEAVIGQRLCDRLSLIRFQPTHMVDVSVGCGAENTRLMLQKTYPKASITPLALSDSGIIESASCDLVFSHFALSWCPDAEAALHTFQRLLKPNGVLLFSALGVETDHLALWPADSPALFDLQDIGEALVRVGLVHPVMDVDRLRLEGEGTAARCEVIYGHAWGIGTPTTATFPLAALTRR